jgi:sugar phosphate isomerase/epimerase
MKIALGVDTLSYHCRIEASEIDVEDVFADVAALGASYVQLDLHHVRGRSMLELERLRDHAESLGLGILTSGDFVGSPRRGDSPADGVDRIDQWMSRAAAVGSPIVRVASGFYRAELAGEPGLIEAEQRYVIDTLLLARERLGSRGIKILLENHSDFTPQEYSEIVSTVGSDAMGVFLDLINPVATLSDPVTAVTALVPHAVAGHIKDYRFVSHFVDDGYHRRGFEVQWCYPGEGVADLASLIDIVTSRESGSPYFLAIEGLDNRAGVADQHERLGRSLGLLRTLIGDDLLARSTI